MKTLFLAVTPLSQYRQESEVIQQHLLLLRAEQQVFWQLDLIGRCRWLYSYRRKPIARCRKFRRLDRFRHRNLHRSLRWQHQLDERLDQLWSSECEVLEIANFYFDYKVFFYWGMTQWFAPCFFVGLWKEKRLLHFSCNSSKKDTSHYPCVVFRDTRVINMSASCCAIVF